jgi:mono/diheme cytochrome c family protein
LGNLVGLFISPFSKNMKTSPLPFPRILPLLGSLLLAVSCANPPPAGDRDHSHVSFARVKPVLERNCVHCHAAIRLPGMPSLTDTKAIAGHIGPGKLIVPGKPEQSRFYLVAALSDDEAGAMPPTGHAMEANELSVLRDWIQGGAPVPGETILLHPEGIPPRSR